MICGFLVGAVGLCLALAPPRLELDDPASPPAGASPRIQQVLHTRRSRSTRPCPSRSGQLTVPSNE
jgi:hypothetical protein